MSDDLVKRLDNLWSMLEDEGFYTKANTAILAKDRIEELEGKLDMVEALMDAGFAEYERRLAKAVKALEEIKRYSPCGDARRKAIDTLAELKGETGE
jgi:hypothetical protein